MELPKAVWVLQMPGCADETVFFWTQAHLGSACCRSCRQQVVCFLHPRPAGNGGAASPALPDSMLSHRDALLAAALQAVQSADSGEAGGGSGLTAEQLRRRMRASLADLLLDDDGD